MSIAQINCLPHQIEFLQDTTTRFLGLVAGYGSGKTRALIYKCLDLAALNVGTDAGLFSATHELATDILIPEMDERLEELKIRHTFKSSPRPSYHLHFKHGTTKVLVRSFENWRRIVGGNYSFACVDEVDTLKPDLARKSWLKLMGRVRVGKVNQIATTTTPEGFAFLYQFFIKEAGSDRRLIRACTLDNPFVSPDFINDLLANYSPELVKAYIYGEFVNLTAGTIYSSFDRTLNKCFDAPELSDRLHIGMDFNVGKMAAIVHVLRADLPRAVDELFDLQDTPAMIQAIKKRFPDHSQNKLITVYPDASGGNTSSKNASESDLTLLRQAGFSVVVNASNPGVKDRINAMNAAFCNANGDRRYLVNPLRCPRYTECLEQQVWRDGQPDKTQGHDHGNDAGGYVIVKLLPIKTQRINRPIAAVSYTTY